MTVPAPLPIPAADPSSPWPPGTCRRCGRPNQTLRDLAGYDCLACYAERVDLAVILDHADVPEPTEPGSSFVTGRCAQCGVAVDRHLSYGVRAQQRHGGNAFDYCRGPSVLRPAS